MFGPSLVHYLTCKYKTIYIIQYNILLLIGAYTFLNIISYDRSIDTSVRVMKNMYTNNITELLLFDRLK